MSAQWADLWNNVMKVEQYAICLFPVTARHTAIQLTGGREFALVFAPSIIPYNGEACQRPKKIGQVV